MDKLIKLIYFYRDSYFALPQPKSTGREYFNREFIKDYLDNQVINDLDLIATGSFEQPKSNYSTITSDFINNRVDHQ